MSNVKCQKSNVLGQSIIEIIVAVAIFIIIAGSSVVIILGSFLSSRLAEEETQAVGLSVEGLEAVQSIRDKNWASLADGDYGLSNAGDSWTFSGTSDTQDKFDRIVNISSVERDESGDIVSTGVVADSSTKKVTSSVTWDFTAARTNTVEMTTYLTNWQEARKVAICLEYCEVRGYSGGACRRNTQACSNNSETYQSGGDTYCTGGQQEDTCCCLP